jgi:hypothetical protein
MDPGRFEARGNSLGLLVDWRFEANFKLPLILLDPRVGHFNFLGKKL